MALPKVGVQLALEGASDFFADLHKAQQEMAALGKANISGAAFGDLAKGANDAAGSIDKLGRGAQDAGGGFSALKEVGIGALREIGAAAVNVGAELGAMAAGFLADSVSAAGDFEASVNNLAAVSGTALADAGFSFDDVSEKALQLGADTRFSASESIAAMTELVKGGVPVSQVMDQATQATLDLAAAAGVELGSAAEIVAKQFGVWSDTGISTTQISDLLTQAANASTVGVEDLALGLANVGGVAKVSGLDFEELTQTMALIAPGFSSAADAGTSLKTFLTSLNPATAPAREAMADLGLFSSEMGSAFFDASGSFVGMEQASALLQQSLAGLSQEQQQAALKAIFGQDAFRAAALIAEAGAPGFVAMGESMAAAGTAAETAAIQNQGWNFALDQFKAGIETLQITLGTLFLPILTSVAGAFSGVVEQVTTVVKALSGNQEAFAQLSPTLQRIVTIVQSVSGALADAGPFSLEFAESLSLIHPALQPLMQGLSQVVSFIQANFIPVMATVAGALLGALVPGIAAAVAAAGGIGGVFAAAGAAVAGAGAAFLTIAAPIAAVAALAAALATAWQSNLGGIRDATAAAMAAIGGALQSGAAVVQVVLNQISAFWAANGAEITAFAQQAWGQLSTIIGEVAAIVMTIVGGLATTLSGIFQGIASFIAAHGDTIQSVLSSAWQVVSGIVSGALNILQGVVRTVLGVIRGDWDGAWKGVQQVAQGAMGILRTIFSSGLDLIKGLFTLAVAGIRTVLSGFVGQAMTLGRNIIDGVVNGVKAGASALAGAVQSAAQNALNSAKRALGISSPSKVAAETIGCPMVAGVAAGIEECAPLVEETLSAVGADAVAASEGVGAAISAATADGVQQGGADLAAAFRNYFAVIVEDGDILNDFLADLPTTAQDSVQQVGRALAAASAASAESGAALADTLGKYFEAVVEDGDHLNDFLADLPEGLQDAVASIGRSLDTAAIEGSQAVASLATAVGDAGASIGTTGEVVTEQMGQLGADVSRLLAEGMGTAILNAPGTGQEVTSGIAAGIERGKPAIEAALRSVSQEATKVSKATFKISSPSQLFADEIGQPIVAGTAKGILDNIEILLNAASKMGAIVLQEAKTFAKTVQDALGPLLAQAYKGAADYARSKAGALADLGSLFNVDSSEYDRLKEAAGEASREAARLFFGDDKDAAAGAQAIYSQLAAQRNAARAVLEQQRTIAKEAQQQILAAQKAVAGITDPAERAAAFNVQKSAILETAKLRQQIVGATDQEERQRLEEQLRLIQEAQKAEFALYESEAKERQRQRDQQLREAKEALKQLGNLVFYSQQDVFGKGEDLIKGLINGAVSQTDALKDALAKMLNDALTAMKKQMGIRSPSKVFALELGAPIGQGVISGAERALGGLGATLAADLRGAAGIAAQTIRPPARAGQLAGSMHRSTTYAPVYNYSPQYQGAPRQPMQDFAIMRSLYGRGG